MPSQKILEKKKDKVQVLAEKFKKAKMIVLTEYRGISVEDDTKLRATIRNNGDEYSVVKNSIIAHAAKEAGIEGLDNLEGPTAVVIGYEDYVTPAKAVNDYAKDNEFYTIKAGVMDGKMIEVSEVKKLAIESTCAAPAFCKSRRKNIKYTKNRKDNMKATVKTALVCT